MIAWVDVELPACPPVLERLQPTLDSFCEDHRLSVSDRFMLELALDEVVSNVIHHGFGGPQAHELVRVRIALDGDTLQVQVRDGAPPFNPLERPAPDVDAGLLERSPGGLGLFLVKETMDEVVYRREDGTNCLTMSKLRSLREPAASS